MSDDRKTADLRRQPGCTIHTLVSHRTHAEAVSKATIRSEEVTGESLASAIAELARPEIDWLPTAVFACALEHAVLIERGRTTAWP